MRGTPGLRERVEDGGLVTTGGSLRMRSLRELRSRDLRVLLDEEIGHWANELDWDFADVASAVADAVDARTVAGRAVQDGPRALAYCYWLREQGRAVVGSLFAVEQARGRGLEERLLDAVLAEAQAGPDCARVEGQTLFSTTAVADENYTRGGFKGRARQYLVRDLAEPLPAVPGDWSMVVLARSHIPEAARLVFESHSGTVDAVLNSVYLSAERTRQFVETLVLHDGCGRFMAEASLAAFGPEGLIGVVVCSRVSHRNGHICQVSVLPRLHGRGLGRALVVAALARLRRAGLTTASLSVTAGNERATRLYARLGFRLHRSYGAYAWVRPPQRLCL
jgi:ribosomal protein S18 acetylase RimI-like enzyme